MSNVLASLGHTGRRAFLSHTLNTQTLVKTDEQKKVLSKCTILCWAAFIATLGHMRPPSHRLDTPARVYYATCICLLIQTWIWEHTHSLTILTKYCSLLLPAVWANQVPEEELSVEPNHIYQYLFNSSYLLNTSYAASTVWNTLFILTHVILSKHL